MRILLAATAICLCAAAIGPAAASESCSQVKGDVVLKARTPEVDLYDAPNGKRVETLKDDKFPDCTPITGRAPNMMLRIDLNGTQFWVPPHMVKYHFAGTLAPVCRNLAMGTAQVKLGSTRGLGEGCPKPGSAGGAQ